MSRSILHLRGLTAVTEEAASWESAMGVRRRGSVVPEPRPAHRDPGEAFELGEVGRAGTGVEDSARTEVYQAGPGQTVSGPPHMSEIMPPLQEIPGNDLIIELALDGAECHLDQLLDRGMPAGTSAGRNVVYLRRDTVTHFMDVRAADVLTTLYLSSLDERGARSATCWVGDHCFVVGVETTRRPSAGPHTALRATGEQRPGDVLLVAVLPNGALPHLVLDWAGPLGGRSGAEALVRDPGALGRRLRDAGEPVPAEALSLRGMWSSPWRSWRVESPGRTPLELITVEGYGVYRVRGNGAGAAMLQQRPSGLAWGDIVQLCTDVLRVAEATPPAW